MTIRLAILAWVAVAIIVVIATRPRAADRSDRAAGHHGRDLVDPGGAAHVPDRDAVLRRPAVWPRRRRWCAT